MSALLELLEKTRELVSLKIQTIDQYNAQIDHFIKLGNKTGASINSISSGVQNIRALITNEIDEIQVLHNEAAGVLRTYLNNQKQSHAPNGHSISIRSRDTTAQDDYDREGMEHIRHSHNDQCDALRSISEPLEDAA